MHLHCRLLRCALNRFVGAGQRKGFGNVLFHAKSAVARFSRITVLEVQKLQSPVDWTAAASDHFQLINHKRSCIEFFPRRACAFQNLKNMENEQCELHMHKCNHRSILSRTSVPMGRQSPAANDKPAGLPVASTTTSYLAACAAATPLKAFRSWHSETNLQSTPLSFT